MKEQLLKIGAITTLATLLNSCNLESPYGVISKETTVSEGNVSVGVINEEGSRSFNNCDPKTLRRELGMPNRTTLVGTPVRYKNLQRACPTSTKSN